MSTRLALESLREMPDSVEKVVALKNFADQTMNIDHILAKEAVSEAIDLAVEMELDLLLAQSYIVHSNIDFNLRNIDASFQLTEKALAIYEKIGDEKGIARCYNSIAALTTQLQRHEISIEYLEKALQLNLKNEDWKGCALNKLNIGYLYLSLKEFEKSEKHILESLENYILKIKEAQEQKKLTASAHQFLLELYKTMGDFENLRKWIEETLSYIEGDEG
ncbi:MAG: tetratricopeptide repeat protein [Bacteroidetes bacterium]|nr:tetratricopeptide repeat protein [Bacteroidota bacterium]